MRAGKTIKVKDERYQRTERSLVRRILSLLKRRGGQISVWEVCTGENKRNKKIDGGSSRGGGSGVKKGEKEFCTTAAFYDHYKNIDDAIEQIEAKVVGEFAERLEKLQKAAGVGRAEVGSTVGVTARRTGVGSTIGVAAGVGELPVEEVLREMLRFMRQNKQVFIATAECRRLGTYEEIFKLVYPLVARDFPNYAGAAAQEQLFWLYLGQNMAVVLAWVRQTGCEVEEERKCLRQLLAVQQRMGRYMREVGVADYQGAKVEAADLPKGVRERYFGKAKGVEGAGGSGME